LVLGRTAEITESQVEAKIYNGSWCHLGQGHDTKKCQGVLYQTVVELVPNNRSHGEELGLFRRTRAKRLQGEIETSTVA
jgi:hypothetical protein